MTEPSQIRIGFLDSLWKFFASIRLTVVVLLTLAVLSIIGTVIPQNQSPADYFRTFGPFLYQLMSTLDIFDMYHAWWFQCLIVTMAVNIIVCSIDRLRSTWRIIFVKAPFNLEQFRRRKNRHEFKKTGSADALKAPFQKRVAAIFGPGSVVQADVGFAITAEKGRWTRLGVYAVHLSIVILLIGALAGSIFGFEGYVNIAEGEQADTIQLRNTSIRYTLPFSIRCNDFDVQFYAGSRRPKEFRSSLTIIKGDREILQKDIVVNDPLRYQGINIFQSSYGELGPSAAGVNPPQSLPSQIELHFQSAASGIIYTRTTGMGKSVDLPEGLGRFTLERYEPSADFKGMNVGPALAGTLTPANGRPQSVLLPLDHPQFDRMRRGAVVISAGNVLQPPQPRYYTGLQVTKNPGVGIVYLGFIMMIAGCVVAFFMSHQRLVVEVRPDGKKVNVLVSGTANKNKIGFDQKLRRLTEQLEKTEG